MTIINNAHRATIVPASAGAGKTYRLTHEYLYDTLRNRRDDNEREYFDPTIYKRILAVTFTNKATEEMKSRILSEIHKLASGEDSAHLKELMRDTSLSEATIRSRAKIVRSAILHDYSHFSVLTNDTFFQRILRAFIRELGLDLNFTTEIDTTPLVIRSVDAVIEDITKDATLRKWLEELTAERINDGMKWDIREAILTFEKSLFSEATHDIISNLSDKESLRNKVFGFRSRSEEKKKLIISKAKAAADYISSHGYSNDDFYGKFTKYFDTLASGNIKAPALGTIAHISDSLEAWFKKGKATPELYRVAAHLQQELGDIYSLYLEYAIYDNTSHLLFQNYRSLALLYDLQKKVKELCRDDNAMLLSETRHTISTFISEAETPFIYEKVGNYFDKFMIDEFQDTSAKEWHNFLPLLRNAMAQSDENSILIVGDVKQSIYRWRGGDWNILGSKVAADLKDVDKIPLEDNWRSLPNIIEFNNNLFSNIVNGDNQRLNDMLDDGKRNGILTKESYEVLYNMLHDAYFGHAQHPMRKHKNRGFISVESFDKKDKKASKFYIERIREAFALGYKPCDITILVRKNPEAAIIADELLSARSTFAEHEQFEITTEEALNINASPATHLIIALLRLAINRNDTASLTIYNNIHKGNRFDAKLDDEEEAFLDHIRILPLEEAFENIIIRYKRDIEGATAYIQALHDQIVHFSAGKVSDIALFDKWWREKSDKLSIRVERSERTIEIMTIHKAKGLENKVIIIPMCNWDIDPKLSRGYTTNIVWAKPQHNDPLAELGAFPLRFNNNIKNSLFADGYHYETVYSHIDNINLLYVALTRAKEHLYISVPVGTAPNIGTLLLQSLPSDLVPYEVEQEDIDESFKPRERYILGECHTPEPNSEKSEKESAMMWLNDYNASPVTIKMRTSTSRYFDDTKSLTPRSAGIKLHRIFEGADSREELLKRVRNMATDGDISSSEIASLEQQIHQTLDQTIAGEWFDGSWDKILHESSIIRPKESSKRPDRVMIKGKQAVVVDYKFGAENESHIAQIETYKKQLRTMGYNDIRGYLWYVSAGKVKEVK